MDKIEVKEIKNGEYYVNIFSETGDDMKISKQIAIFFFL